MIKKRILIISICLIQVSCSSIGDALPFYRYTVGTWTSYISSLGLNITEEQHNEIPYAYIYARIGSSRFSRLILLSETDGLLEWISADREKIYTLNGKIVKTEGLINDFDIINKEVFNSFPDSQKSFYPITDFFNPKLSNLQSEIIINKPRKKRIKNPISGREKIDVSVFEEIHHIEKIYWKASNLYYLNNDNEIERTVQKVHPSMPEIEIVFVRKFKQ